MQTRFSLFSHTERLDNGSLELGDPFAPGPPRVCRYELHRQTEAVLEPDEAFNGLSAYHRLLPLSAEQLPAQCSIFETTPWASSFAKDVADLQWLNYNPALATVIAEPAAREQGLPIPVDLTSPDNPFGPWRNPFRLEGLKTIGLALMNAHPTHRPTLLVHDPTGELTFALTLASQIARAFDPSQVPYRIILIQSQPPFGLCQVFESGGLTTAESDTPAPVPALIAAELVHHLGTAIALHDLPSNNPEPTLEDIYTEALDRLIRTRFLDDEDHVYCISSARQ